MLITWITGIATVILAACAIIDLCLKIAGRDRSK